MTDRRKIAFVVTDCISANLLMRGQIEYLEQHGAEVHVFAGGSAAEKARFASRGVGMLHAIPFRRQPHLGWDLVALIRLTLALSKMRFDAVVCSTPKAMLLGSIAAFLTQQPRRVALVRGRAYEKATGLKRRIYLAFDRIAFSCSHRILFISRSLAEAFKADGIDPGVKGRVVGDGSSNGVDVIRFAPPDQTERDAARRRLGFGEGDFVVVAVGRITSDKGVEDALAVAHLLEDLPQLRLLFVGEVEDERLSRQLRSAPDARIRLLPADPAPERYLAAADLHLFLSHREGFGNVAIEAAAMGVPTFAFDVVGVRDSVAAGVTGELFPFGETSAVAAAIRLAASDPAAFRQRYAGARSHVVSRFDQQAVWARYAEAFGVSVQQG